MICSTSCLLLTLQGQYELLALQNITLDELDTPSAYPTRCVVQDERVSAGAETELIDWLLTQLLPALHRAGVRHWAWVCSPTPGGYRLARQVASRLPQLELTLFSDLEHASTWLRQLH